MKDHCKQIGERLKELRLEQGYTQQQVADYLKIDQSNYSKIEKGKRKLNKLSQVIKLCELYDCTQNYLLLKDNEHSPQKWRGMGKEVDLNIIAQANMTMRYLKMLRDIQKKEDY